MQEDLPKTIMTALIQLVAQLFLCQLSYGILASFYGDSFLFQSVQLPSSLDTTSVYLRFQTSSSDGLMLLALGDKGYLSVEMKNAQIAVRIDLGFGEEILLTPEKQPVNDLLWNELRVVRSRRSIKLILNREDVATGQINVPRKTSPDFDINLGVFVGGTGTASAPSLSLWYQSLGSFDHNENVISCGKWLEIKQSFVTSDCNGTRDCTCSNAVLIGGNVSLPHGLRTSKRYRGCLLNAEINQQQLLSPLMDILNERIVYNVVSGCPKLFRASRSEPLTFESAISYVALKRWTSHEEGSFECSVKTSKRTGIILYHAGRGIEEFIGLEMVDGVIGAAVNKGSGVVGLRTTSPINDNRWHTIRFKFSPSYLEIHVDGERTKAFVEQTDVGTDDLEGAAFPHNLDLSGYLYVGGVPSSILQKSSLQHRLISFASPERSHKAFPGCMKNIKVNHRPKGFSDFLISFKTSAGCKKNFSYHNETVAHDSVADRDRANVAINEMLEALSRKLASTTTPTSSESGATEAPVQSTDRGLTSLLVNITSMAVLEGGHAVITNNELKVEKISGQQTTVESDDIMVLVTRLPSHGRLTMQENCVAGTDLSKFSLADLNMNKIRYCHDGSETNSDDMDLTFLWNISKVFSADNQGFISDLPQYVDDIRESVPLNNGIVYSLPIIVKPTNDPPILEIPLDYVFHPIKETITHLPADALKAVDPDSSPKHVVYSILGNVNSAFIAYENNPEVLVNSFTQEDVDRNRMIFVHTGNVDNARLILRVTNSPDDLISGPVVSTMSSTAVLRIAALPLNITVHISNVTLVEKDSVVLTEDFLAASSNAENGDIDFRYRSLEAPVFGEIQVKRQLQDGGQESWVISRSFTQSQFKDGRVRYRNRKTSDRSVDPELDKFKFVVAAAGAQSPPHTLFFHVQKVTVRVIVSSLDMTKGIQQTEISKDIFQVKASNIQVTSDQILIKFTQDFMFFDVFYRDNQQLISRNTLSLKDVEKGNVAVKIKSQFASQFCSESVGFIANVKAKYSSAPAVFNVSYEPDLTRIQILSTGLVLEEGQEKTITKRMLHASLPPNPLRYTVKKFEFTVTKPPSNGQLLLKNKGGGKGSNRSVVFALSDIEQGNLFYKHDDSETATDAFSFHVVPVLEANVPEQLSDLSSVYANGDFNISIRPVDDHRPVRTVDKPFEIARHSERLLTPDDLWFSDSDTDFNPMDLLYIRHRISNGEILNATSRRHEKVYRFRQRDIANGHLLFRHKGADYGRFVFSVRDRNHIANGLFIVSASDPYIRMENNSQLLVLKGLESVISSQNLWTVTNVKGAKEKIIYNVTSLPTHGTIMKRISDVENITVSSFTQQDVFDHEIIYRHDGSSHMEDIFLFEVSAGSNAIDRNLTVKVFLESHQKPPAVQRNQTALVKEGERIQIRKQDLRITHPGSRASDIWFSVKKAPAMGDLKMRNRPNEELMFNPVSEFTQHDINHGQVWYIHNGSSAITSDKFVDGVLLDRMIFDVENGIQTVRDLRFNFDIIPKKIPLRLTNFTISEGKSQALTLQQLHVLGSHFDDIEIELRVVKSPKHGMLESSRETGIPLEKFPLRLAAAEFLYYVHDGSDTLEDDFSLQAFSTDGRKESRVETAYITVVPENDQIPVVVNNTGMKVWINSTTLFTPSMLGARDNDSSVKDLRYEILPPINGRVALRDAPTVPVLNFTQYAINNGKVVFVHEGSNAGGFTFQVADGANYDKKRIFSVTAKPLLIQIERNTGIKVFPLSRVPITTESLYSSTNDYESDRTIIYTISAPSVLGYIAKANKNSENKNDTGLLKIQRFTQRDVDEGSIIFIQDQQPSKWTQIDSFMFTTSSIPAKTISGSKFMINVTYNAFETFGKSSPISKNEGFSVVEGGSFVISTDRLDASNLYKKLPSTRDRSQYELIYLITKLPQHGNVSIAGVNVTKVNKTFTQSDLVRRHVAYRHDHSDTLEDFISFDVYLTDKKFVSSTGKPWVVPGSFYDDIMNITIDPLNDNPPVLVTKGSILKVVDGFETPVPSTVLSAVDPDNPPEEIMYKLIRNPSRGELHLLPNDEKAVRQFSQQDINEGNVVFVPFTTNVTEDGLNDAFYFGVTDGIQKPSFYLFQIKIVPVYVDCFPKTLEIIQGFHSVRLAEDILNVTTNGNYSLLSFRLAMPAASGFLLVKEKNSSSFSYRDVSEKKVTFAMTSNSHSADVLHLDIQYNRDFGLSIRKEVEIKIVVKSNIYTDAFTANVNGLTKIGLSSLNATCLLHAAKSLPSYEILAGPSAGKIVKVIVPDENNAPADRAELLQEVASFTHNDVELGHVFIEVPNINMTNMTRLEDRIVIRSTVVDGTAQPAEFQLDFSIVNRQAEDYDYFFDRFFAEPVNEDLEDEIGETTLPTASEVTISVSPPPKTPLTFNKKGIPKDLLVPSIDRPMNASNAVSSKPNLSESSTIYWWMILLVVLFVLIILLIGICCCLWLRKRKRPSSDAYSKSRHEKNKIPSEHCESFDSGASGLRLSNNQLDGELVCSPACPGVTVTLLNADMQLPETISPLLYSAKDPAESIFTTSVPPQYQSTSELQSFYADQANPSTVYAPSTLYRYENADDREYLNRDGFSRQAMYHAKSDRLLDPDVLALYSSDESIPLTIDEKYATPYRGGLVDTGSVPLGLNLPETSVRDGVCSRSIVSLPGASPKLSLAPNANLDATQYWF